jgi:hypothetical protein
MQQEAASNIIIQLYTIIVPSESEDGTGGMAFQMKGIRVFLHGE